MPLRNAIKANSATHSSVFLQRPRQSKSAALGEFAADNALLLGACASSYVNFCGVRAPKSPNWSKITVSFLDFRGRELFDCEFIPNLTGRTSSENRKMKAIS